MIRNMLASDKSNYFEMSRDFYMSGAAKGKIDDGKREKFWVEILNGVFVNGFIIEHGNKTAGYALVCYYASQEFGGKVVWIDELFIKPEFRGKGLGKDFLKFAESLDGVLMRLEAEPDNLRAIELYKSIGYKELEYLQLIKRK